MHLAVEQGNAKVMQLLLDSGAISKVADKVSPGGPECLKITPICILFFNCYKYILSIVYCIKHSNNILIF